jgi:NADH-quinone oxidoreductase subunit N
MTMDQLARGAFLLGPEIVLVVFGLLILLIDLFLIPAGASRRWLAWLAVLGTIVSAASTYLVSLGGPATAFGGFLAVDGFAIFFKYLFLLATALVILASEPFISRHSSREAEFYGLLLLTTVGLNLMAATTEFMSIYLALEISSLSLAFLAAFSNRDLKSSEAGLKFLILSALSSALLLYGIAMLYGLTGATTLNDISQVLQSTPTAAALLAMSMVLAGFGFKIAIVPFQMWTPDVYEGAPTPVTAYMSVASKAAGFAVLIRVFQVALPSVEPTWTVLIAWLAFFTMTFGNLAALAQTNIKRMLAYSSIAHVGFVLLGLAAASPDGIASSLYYLLVYTVTNLATFIVVIVMGRYAADDSIASYAGLARRSPWLAFSLALGLLSLAGLPPLAGFFSKFFVFWAAWQQGWYFLVAAGVLNSVVSLFYYSQIIRQLYLAEPTTPRPVITSGRVGLSLGVAVAGVMLVGLVASPFLGAAGVAAQRLVP